MGFLNQSVDLTDRALKGRCEPSLRYGSRSASGRPLTALALNAPGHKPPGPPGRNRAGQKPVRRS